MQKIGRGKEGLMKPSLYLGMLLDYSLLLY
jgi:hypothetical protein